MTFLSSFVFACIVPHGGEIIPELASGIPSRMETTRKSMEQLGQSMNDSRVDSIIVLTPHGTKINGQFCVVNSERMIGEVAENDQTFSMERVVERELAGLIADRALANDLPVGTINFGTASGPYSCLPLDWGAIVPLRFMPKVPIVVITPSRDLSYEQHLSFGRAINQAVQTSNKKVGLIASCDWSHTHDETGPYGFHESAKKLDKQVVDLIKRNELEALANFDPIFIDQAKPDGIWQSLILAGAIPKDERQITFLSYEAPTYFGLICAAVI